MIKKSEVAESGVKLNKYNMKHTYQACFIKLKETEIIS